MADRVRLSAADDALAPERTRLTAALAAESLAPLRTLHRTASASHAAATAQEAARRSALAALTADAPVLTAVHAAAPTALAVTQGQLATDPASPMPPQAGPDPATVSAAPATDSPDSAAVDIPRARTAPPPAVLPPLSALPSAAPAELAAAERHLRAESGRLEAARADEDRHRRLTRERADLIAERDRAEELAEESEDWLVDYEDRLKQLHTELDEARSAHALLTQLDAQRADLTLRHEAAQQHRRLHAARTAAEARTTDLHKAFLDARAHTLDLQERRLAGMAAELAEELADGAPCRVCGSAEHPAPARPSASPVTAADEQRARDAQHAAEQRFNAAQAELTALQVDEAAAAAASGGRAVAELAAEIAELAERWQAARQTAERLVPLGQQVERLERERAARADRLRQAGERSAGLAGRLGTVVVELAELAARLAEARGDAPSVAARAAALDRLTGAVADTLAAARAAAEAATRLSEATEAFAEAARSAGFADPAAVEAAHLPAAERELLRQRLQALDTALEQNRARLADPDLLAASRLPPAAPAVARAAEEDATAALRRAAAEHRSAADRVEALARIGRTLVSLAATFAPVLDAHARISRLAGLLAGAPAENALRMRLESYVLAARLEQVAAAASHRLLKMSGGRYTLVHSDGLVSGNRRSGLSLHVVDAWTGRERDTATLSGGESFFASLALALGLADVVTDEAGGMPLDTLFIDEGFGTLDENALEEVMDVLDSLRERDRAVGIVSHVADLRTRIPAQLLIRKHRHGSTVHHTTRADA
ncbi:SbcC/MukB-like Walker B domain-containing protein [Kitasatospora sp. NPDC049285]|uniref:SbcC/MukB-like Walker B domain-containing protein n=1 Tax=Kitasatospora sp. NPDC049285 TaxID=3157096 RepID=UPI003436B59D